MSTKNIIVTNEDGSLNFGDNTLTEKTKIEDYEYQGDSLKIKTFNEVTKLKRNGNLLYESDPGSVVTDYKLADNGVSFTVDADADLQITLGLKGDTEYKIIINGAEVDSMKSKIGGKLSFHVDVTEGPAKVEVIEG